MKANIPAISVDGTSFALNGNNVSYRLHVDSTGDLHLGHFGPTTAEELYKDDILPGFGGWSGPHGRTRRELPDLGRGDLRVPAIQIAHDGHTVTEFKYRSHTVLAGKPALAGLPATFGDADQVSTLVVEMYDALGALAVHLSYSIFPQHDAIVRSVRVENRGKKQVTLQKVASLSVDLPVADMDILSLRGEWAREAQRVRQKVEYGVHQFGSVAGYSSHIFNPFLGLVSATTTESHGDAWGFSLVYSGSFSAEVDQSSQGLIRAVLGLNREHLAWPLPPGESFTTPECVAVFSRDGINGMSQRFHGLYREHLIRSVYAHQPRPPLLNSWEGLVFDLDETAVYELAADSAQLGAKLFVLDDGWFGVKYPRVADNAGLGDWEPNPARFPDGLQPLLQRITALRVAGTAEETLQFGLWLEPEMVSPASELYDAHPDWVLHAGDYPRTETRFQLVLNLAMAEVQEFIIDFVSKLLRELPIRYIKWDNNRAMHELPSPATAHAYLLGLYRVLDVLTTRFPSVLWEGCASGGGRFDPGMLFYFPQSWTSDNTDAVERIAIQLGTSLVYPASSMGAHISAVPNGITHRTTPLTFRAHVAMMGGSFGLELDSRTLDEAERAAIPPLIALAEKINPLVINGDLWRLRLPDSNYPAAIFVSKDHTQAVLFAFQIRATINHSFPVLRLQGLDPAARYTVDGKGAYLGSTLMNGGMQLGFTGDHHSRVIFLTVVV
ncbi:hypothetical protein ASPZODRAFT_77061 [Penicilliopsis zonata CBS 506.65]|uniref:Alpha-galactosidase n=1 Tax=Penicilliopsis zonata CBS 506.65 TaxID=1073090 RepID=A0A1L9S569_9EURO|nr:hypothetical protein ASPZODRAFT_77061 [Penicilliopsis zonata CBS 506.65]OJJ42315.1 hypothetical protein ASPZODRAFT_77061 [Penicilliopsis zonata CBS 506.65]